MDTIRQDLRYALRSLAGAPLFTAVALVSLGLGIGVNGAIFSIADRTVLEPLPAVTDADRLVVVEPGSNSHAAFADLRAATTFEAAAVANRTMNLRSGEGTELVDVQVVSGEYFDVVGVAARAAVRLGR